MNAKTNFDQVKINPQVFSSLALECPQRIHQSVWGGFLIGNGEKSPSTASAMRLIQVHGSKSVMTESMDLDLSVMTKYSSASAMSAMRLIMPRGTCRLIDYWVVYSKI